MRKSDQINDRRRALREPKGTYGRKLLHRIYGRRQKGKVHPDVFKRWELQDDQSALDEGYGS